MWTLCSHLFLCMFRKAQQCDGYVSWARRSLVNRCRGGSSFRLKVDSAISLLSPPRMECGRELRAVWAMFLQIANRQTNKFNFRIHNNFYVNTYELKLISHRMQPAGYRNETVEQLLFDCQVKKEKKSTVTAAQYKKKQMFCLILASVEISVSVCGINK